MVVCLLVGCAENSEQNTKILDAIITSTTYVGDAVAANPAWGTALDTGTEINGVLQENGSITIQGWRFDAQQQAANGFHGTFSEKLFLIYEGWAELDVVLSGNLVVTRHHIDFGTPQTIQDANRTTTYEGQLSSSGAATGSFPVQIHGQITRNVQWTCGTIDGEGIGVGACY
jgi:hypothetical protein